MGLSDLFKTKVVPGKPEHLLGADFQHEVLESELPVLVDFWASWCGPCRMLGGLLEEVGPEFVGRIRILKLDVDESQQTAAQYGVSSIPTMIFFKGGHVVDRVVGALPLNPLRERIEQHALKAQAV